MSSSASSTENATIRRRATAAATTPTGSARVGGVQRFVARVLVATLVFLTPSTGFAGGEFESADHAVLDGAGTIDNTQSGLTEIATDEASNIVDWTRGFDQPEGHTLRYSLSADGAQILNRIRGDQAAIIRGRIESGADDTILFASPHGLYVGSTAVIDVGNLVAVASDLSNLEASGDLSVELSGEIRNEGLIQADGDVFLYAARISNLGEILTPAGQVLLLGADSVRFLEADTIAEGLLDPIDFVALLGESEVSNQGRLEARDATLIGRRVLNEGHIEIADGTLMILGGDAVHLRSIGDPVVVSLPHESDAGEGALAQDYAVENRGTIEAGAGRVRLAAADPLGWGIRQRTLDATHDAPAPRIAAATIEIAGGEGGRVELAGEIDASDSTQGGVGGDIEITGETIVLAEASVDASGAAGGGTIHIGGEQQGRGELQRARGLVVDEVSVVRADALEEGDGGRVILFAESLTHIAGDVSARGGATSGDGGFIETSGLERLSILTTPDASATNGDAGEWLIDPFSITIVAGTPSLADGCGGAGVACLNKALEAILDPNFDSAGFDGILRTVDPSDTLANAPNEVAVDLLVRALSVGTDVTLSTEAFNPGQDTSAEAPGIGDITLATDLLIPDASAAPGTRANLTLLAARNINLDGDILVGDGTPGATPNLDLDVTLTANDQAQRDSTADFDDAQLRGSVFLNNDIRTGGGDLVASGISVEQAATSSIETQGGSVTLTSGSLDRFGGATEFARAAGNTVDPTIGDGTPVTTGITLAGTVDTRREADTPGTGGAISARAEGVRIRSEAGADAGGTPLTQTTLTMHTGELSVSGALSTGGGNVSLLAGSRATTSTGNLTLDGATIDTLRTDGSAGSGGGAVTLDANRIDEEDTAFATLDSDFVGGEEGGAISIGSGASVLTGGGVLSIGSSRTQRVDVSGTLDTTGATPGVEDGLIGIAAGDFSGADRVEERFGMGTIALGATAAATLRSGGITLDAREVITSDSTSPNAVLLEATGIGEAALFTTQFGLASATETDAFARAGTLEIEGDRSIVFGAETTLRGEAVSILAAAIPTDLTPDERAAGPGDPFDPNVRLVFEGDATTGVRIESDDVSIAVSPAFASTDDGQLGDLNELDDMGMPTSTQTDLGLQRQAGANYAGLQLRDFTGADERPETLSIDQSAGLTITGAAPAGDNELFLAGAFGAAPIGALDQTIALSSRNGVLTIADAAALNDGAGESFVTLNGGLLLGDDTNNALGNSVDLSGNATPFQSASLTITTPRQFEIDTSVTSAIGAVDALTIVSGRPTQIADVTFDETALDGTLTVAAGTTLTASESLDLQAAANGLGDLVFETPGGTPTQLASDALSLRAGAGPDGANLDTLNRSEIVGANAIAFRDGMGMPFQSTATETRAFSFQQDAAIDAATHLPTIDDFGLAPGAGFGTAGPRVDYALRSDFGSIDLTTGGFDATQVQDVDILLIGTNTGLPAIQIPDGFVFDGGSVTLGGTAGFTYTQTLADAFTPAGVAAAADKILELRAGSNGIGVLSVASGVTVRAPEIRLIASDGAEGEIGSTISTAGAIFDLSDAAPGERRFAFQLDTFFALSSLPTASQFVDSLGAAALPNFLAVRNDGGSIELLDPDFTALPLDLTDAANPGRLILESAFISLAASGTRDLELTDAPATGVDLSNFRLRLRADDVLFRATGGSALSAGAVLAGDRAGLDTTGPLGPVSDPSDPAVLANQTLLIEGFAADADVTTEDLSSLSETDTDSGIFDLATGRGPNSLTIEQDAAIQATELPDRFNVSGHFARSNTDDEAGDPLPTRVNLDANFGGITIDDRIGGGDLTIGFATDPFDGADESPGSARDVGDITIAPGSYDFESLSIVSEGDILVQNGALLSAQDVLQLEAGVLLLDAFEPISDDEDATRLGVLDFDDDDGASAPLTTIAGREVILRAGPTFRLTDPDTDGDGLGESVADTDGLATIDGAGLLRIDIVAGADVESDTSLQITSSGDLDIADFQDAITTGGGGEWDEFGFGSVQGKTTIGEPAAIAGRVQTAFFGFSNTDASLDIETATGGALFDASGFEGFVDLRSNRLTITSTAATGLDLSSPNLRLVSDVLRTGFETEDELGRISSEVAADPDFDRVVVRLVQDNDFSTTALPRLNAYFQLGLIPGQGILSTLARSDLSDVEIDLETTTNAFTVTDTLRNGLLDSNVVLRAPALATNTLDLAIQQLRPGVGDYDFVLVDLPPDDPALGLTSLETVNFAATNVPDFNPNVGGVPTARDFLVETTGDQRWSGDVALATTFDVRGRDLDFEGALFRATGAPADAGLVVQTDGLVSFGGDLGVSGASANPTLGSLTVVFDDESGAVRFDAADGTLQTVHVEGDTLFTARTLDVPSGPGSPAVEVGRSSVPVTATIGRENGDLTFESEGGDFVVDAGERIAVGGTLLIDHAGQTVRVGDVAALDFQVIADEIELVRRAPGATQRPDGSASPDSGTTFVFNTVDFGGVTPTLVGTGATPRFAVPDPFDPALPAFLAGFPVAAILPGGGALDDTAFAFVDGETLQVAFPTPLGASRSEFTGAEPPALTPIRAPHVSAPPALSDPARMSELGVSARETDPATQVARLRGGAIIDDLGQVAVGGLLPVSGARLDADDAETAIALYESLFGADGEGAADVQRVLQDAVDRYRETTRARRVIGFELRRFVKNRPSTLLEAYTTLDRLDTLFRYHRRLGLSPGEYRAIQADWLVSIQPEGVSLEELSEAIHPSRYVRGSDILDIFGR